MMRTVALAIVLLAALPRAAKAPRDSSTELGFASEDGRTPTVFGFLSFMAAFGPAGCLIAAAVSTALTFASGATMIGAGIVALGARPSAMLRADDARA